MEISPDRNKILLIDLTSWEGHHATYFKKIVNSLIGEGYYVYAASTDNRKLSEWLQGENIDRCSVLDWQLYFYQKILYKSTIVLDRLISRSVKTSPYKFSSMSYTLFVCNLLNKIGVNTPVFFADADHSLPEVPLWLAKILLPNQWISLAVRPSYQSATSWGRHRSRQRFSAEKAFGLTSCKAVLSLHPIYQEFYERCFKSKKFFFLPEIFDVTLTGDYDIPNKIKQLAAGRKIISITGSLTPRRNLQLFLQAAQLLNPDQFFIVAIGHLSPESYSVIELKEIERLSLTLKINSYLKFDYYITADGEFDRLLYISDIVYLQYRNHSFSSNILTKAIYLKKPVIIADNFIMKKMVQRYQWAAIIDEDPQKIAQAIERLADNFRIDEGKYQEFLTDFSEENFQRAIGKAINLLNS